MAQPSPYTPAHEFLADEVAVPALPGSELDREFNNVKTTTDQIGANLALIQRDDGELANGSVDYDQLSAALQTAGLAAATAWLTATAYVVGDHVVFASTLYRCLVAHTSGTFATDLAAAKWRLVTGLPVAGIRLNYDSSTTAADPGDGEFRLNHATPSSATAGYLDNADANGRTVSSLFDLMDDSTSTVRGKLRAEKIGDSSVWAEWNVTGSIVDSTGYRTVTLASGASAGTFTAGDTFVFTFARAGDKGDTGASYAATSVTSNAIASSGSKTFTTQASLAYAVGTRVRAADTSAPSTNWMEGVVTAYSGTTLTFTADLAAGAGTLTAWTFSLAGERGAIGVTGATGAGYTATSVTSIAIASSGSKAFTTQAGLAYTVGARVRATDTANTANWMEGLVTAYSGTTLTYTADLSNGSGTIASWNINLAGERGAAGAGLANVVEDTTPQLGGTLDANAKQVRYSKGADVASPAGGNLTLLADGNYFDITGTNAITSIDTLAAGTHAKLHFDGILTLTHHAIDLILPGGANITTAAGDEAELVEYAAGDWRCTSYVKASGKAVIAPAFSEVTAPPNDIFNARLTLTTVTPVTTADVTAATTIYLTPYMGGSLALYDGANWVVRVLSEISIAVPATTGTVYDVFVYDNAGTPTLELTAWTNDTTRATALTTQNGVYVKTGATTRRYCGSFRTTGVSGQTEDSLAKRYLFNAYHRKLRPMRAVDATNSWTYSSVTVRQANANVANQLDMVIGLSEDHVSASVHQVSAHDSISPSILAGVGVDSTTTDGSQIRSPGYTTINSAGPGVMMQTSYYRGFPGVGRHFLAWLEASSATATTTFYGDNGIANLQSGIHGELMM